MFFGGGGGSPFDFDGHGHGHGGGRPRKDVDTTAFYKLLEIEKNANGPEIKKAYRKLAIKHHPDKGGDPEHFKKITRAYEVLSDNEKRQRYDQGGEDAVDGEGGGGDGSDVFDMFFGGGGGRRGGGGARKRQKTKDFVHPLSVTLEQLYNGATKKVAVNRDVLDKGFGIRECVECEGRGMKVRIVRMGPMIQQSQAPCEACGGQGKSYKTKKEREVLEVYVDKGAPNGNKVVFSGKADEHPDADAGDVIFTLNEKEHPVFKRKGADLFVEETITLLEALTGFTLEVTHLDGRKLQIKTQPGEVITPSSHNPLTATEDSAVEWELLEDFDCTGQMVAQAETQDEKTCKDVSVKKDFTAFVIKQGGATFFQGSREELLSCKKAKKGSRLFVVADKNASNPERLMKAVKGEGMPTHKNPFICGNLFIILKIEFPTEMDEKMVKLLKQALPASKRDMKFKENADDTEIHFLSTMDPVESAIENKGGVAHDSAYDEDQQGGAQMPGGQKVQCNQQ